MTQTTFTTVTVGANVNCLETRERGLVQHGALSLVGKEARLYDVTSSEDPDTKADVISSSPAS